MTGEGLTKKAHRSIRTFVYILSLWNVLLMLLIGSLLYFYTSVEPGYILIGLMLAMFITSLIFAQIISNIVVKPLILLTNTVLHLSPHTSNVAPAELGTLRVGKELVHDLTQHLYDFATATSASTATAVKESSLEISDILLPIIGLDKNGTVKVYNPAAHELFSVEAQPLDQQLDSLLDITLPNNSIGEWLRTVQDSSVNAHNIWRKCDVKPTMGENRNYFDIAARYRKDHPSGIDVIMVLSPQDSVFEAENTALGLIALAVHEIRTPLTIMRGNLEVLEDEALSNLTPEMQDYLKRTSAASQSLNGYITNILGVAKAEEGQLTLNLSEESWAKVVTQIVQGLQERATTRGKQIDVRISDGLPNVAIDTISITEVMTNLIENAIKYSPDTAPKIKIDVTLDKAGMVETKVIDQGLGIPDSVVPNLFNKFSRNHRNSAHITGTGLGLYLCKAIVNAHHGNIWVSSKEGQGTTIGFTLLPFDKLADSDSSSDNIIRTKHGWIKNHSMQRR